MGTPRHVVSGGVELWKKAVMCNYHCSLCDNSKGLFLMLLKHGQDFAKMLSQSSHHLLNDGGVYVEVVTSLSCAFMLASQNIMHFRSLLHIICKIIQL